MTKHSLLYDMHHHTVTYDDEVIYLYRLEIKFNSGAQRELMLTATERDRLIQEFTTFIGKHGPSPYTGGIYIGAPRVPIAVKHWIGIEPRTFVAALNDIEFLY